MEVPKTINKTFAFAVITSLVLFGVAWRLTPHAPNFAPIGALALVISMALGWRASLSATLAALMISDFFIGFYPGAEWTWLSFGLIVGLGYFIRNMPLGWRLPVGVLGASGLFFTVSNFGTWVASGMYGHTLTGLIECYIMALPFLRATLLSDLVFTAALLGAYEVAARYLLECKGSNHARNIVAHYPFSRPS